MGMENWYPGCYDQMVRADIAELAKVHRPWPCGLFLVEDGRGGINHDHCSSTLTDMICLVKQLYHMQAGNESAWVRALMTLHDTDFNAEFFDRSYSGAHWKEANALHALDRLIYAGLAKLGGDGKQWGLMMRDASALAAQHQADIVYARAPVAPAALSPLYDQRLQEIARLEEAQAARRKATDDALEVAFRRQANRFAELVTACVHPDLAPVASVNAPVKGRPFWQRWSLRRA